MWIYGYSMIGSESFLTQSRFGKMPLVIRDRVGNYKCLLQSQYNQNYLEHVDIDAVSSFFNELFEGTDYIYFLSARFSI